MRSLGLLAGMVLVFCALSAAQSAAENSTHVPQSRDALRTWHMFHPDRPELDLFHSEDPQGLYCFTMRTYTVARERANSDVTRLVRYTTCPRADWKLQFRNTVQAPGTR